MTTSTNLSASPFIMVIFGATGDLAQNKLMPSLFSLFKENLLPKDFFIVGFSRRDFAIEDFHKYFESEKEDAKWANFSKHLLYQSGSFEHTLAYQKLEKQLEDIDKKMANSASRLFYLATPPDHYETILDNLVATKLSVGENVKIIIEKPFGKDLETAIHLDKKLAEIFHEKQIFRVDHYLGKETVQNMLAFRFANGIFEPVWNNKFIDHVQITFAEESGIGKRGKFFDGVGILRDVMQNHMMQLISAVAMDQPKSFTKEDLRDARAKVIDSMRLADGKSVTKGQYEDYRKEENVSLNSQTETFVGLKLFAETDRFKGVPFYIRAGKKMPKEVVEISVVFVQTCHILFKEFGCPEIGNVITFRIQPNEGISLRFIAKKPGARLGLDSVDMKFNYKESFGTSGLEAYQRVLLDIFTGDQMLFNRSDELESSWKLITQILKRWSREARSGFAREKQDIQIYQQGNWGPKDANDLIENDGRRWL
jgi:glucose-6-phosphate 1-dehydrogenase